MEELINQIAERTGISKDQARTAAETVISFLKERLPAPVSGALDNFIQNDSEGNDSGNLGGMLGNLGGMFGKE